MGTGVCLNYALTPFRLDGGKLWTVKLPSIAVNWFWVTVMAALRENFLAGLKICQGAAWNMSVFSRAKTEEGTCTKAHNDGGISSGMFCICGSACSAAQPCVKLWCSIQHVYWAWLLPKHHTHTHRNTHTHTHTQKHTHTHNTHTYIYIYLWPGVHGQQLREGRGRGGEISASYLTSRRVSGLPLA